MGQEIDMEKYANVILFLCNELGGKIEGKIKLAKLLYYVDFDHFQCKESMKSITGDTYIAKEMGPVPAHLDEVIDYCVESGKLEVETARLFGLSNETNIFNAKQRPNLRLFRLDEQLVMRVDARRLGHFNGAQLTGLTHNEAPFVATTLGSRIDYELAFYRDDEFGSDNLA
jgi:uncharacterized phage-associated protein